MQEFFDDEAPSSRQRFEEEDFYRDEGAIALQQSVETLREGFSWIAHFQRLHPGYEFLSFDDIPLAEPVSNLSDARLALICLAGVYCEGQKPFSLSPGEVQSQFVSQKFREKGDVSFRLIDSSVETDELSVTFPYLDTRAAEEDMNIIFPVARLRELEEESFIGSVTSSHISLLGYVPDPRDLADSAEKIIKVLKDDGVNTVLLAPGEELSHHSMAYLQRAVEESGIATLSVVLCRDIVEHIGVPRAVHYRFPFGYTFGGPNEDALQLRILKDALRSLLQIHQPGTILDLPYEWVDG